MMQGRVVTDVMIGLARLLRAIPVWRLGTVRILRRDGLTLAALVAIAAAENPTGTALIDDDGILTYAELDRLATEQARALHPTQHAIAYPNHRTFVIAVTAALRAHADAVLLDPSTPRPALPVMERPVVERPGRGRVVVMTSGSTGAPRGVERDVGVGQAVPVASLVRRLPVRRGTPLVVTPPLFHGFGFGFLALGLAFGMPVVISRRVERVAAYVRDHPGCVLVGVPAVLARVERMTGKAEVAAVVSGAGQLHPAVAARLTSSYGQVLFNLYGSSEEGWSTIATPADLTEAPGTIGTPAAGVRVEVLDDEGHRLGPGEVGHLCISSRLEFSQYTDGGTRPRLGGMADSGDLGHRDAAGRFFVDGRADDMVVTGGENVFPAEIEDVLLSHPAVAEVRVDGVPDEEFGARLEAFVVLRPDAAAVLRADAAAVPRADLAALPGSDAIAGELIAYARARLSRHKVPRTIQFADALPRTSTGKPRRRVT
jgi:acyl-CoA synthetase (AMP-forming)/AMP-acid ligase II